MAVPHQFSLRWNNYLRHITLAFDSLRTQEDLVDVTLSCEGRKIRAHKVLLSACSSYFREIFKENPCQHPVIIFKNVKYEDLAAIIEFMYQGEVNVVQESLPSFLHTAELLSVQGLTENKEEPQTTPPCEGTIQLPKLTKIVPVTLQATSSASNIIPTARLNLTTSNSNEYIEIPQHIIKKQKMSESEINSENEDLEYIPQTMKMEIPEYINMTHQSHQQDTHNNSSDVQIQTDDEQILHNEEDDDDDKHYMHDDNFEIVDGSEDAMKSDSNSDNKHHHHQSIETHEIGSVEMSRIFTTQSSGEVVKTQDGELKFRCSICWKGFKHPNSLTLHKDMHTGKTKCPVCFRAFSRSYDMKTHMNKIHKITLKVETKLNLTELK